MTDIAKDLSKNLNPTQADAAQSIDGPLLILAGAGSGKTRVLTYRVANIVVEGKASPHEILAVTFTNKAAREMQHRASHLLEQYGVRTSEPMWISTFHSIGARILRDHIHLLGYESFFTICDSSDQLNMIKRVCNQLDLNDKIYPPKRLQHQINEAKMLALKPNEMDSSPLVFDEKTIDVYSLYEDEMKKSNCLDFSDLLFKTLLLFRDFPDVLKTYQSMFKYVLVDEYQDTNHIQYLILRMLCEDHQNICVVGDEDQSIYSWRGADIRNILDFEKDFPNAKMVKLEENYRSTQTIVKAASELISNNSQRREKTLFSEAEIGEKIEIREEATEYEEAKFVIKEIEARTRDAEFDYNDFAVFYRTNAQSRVLEEQLRSHSIPYKMYGGIKFYERMEIKDILGYLRLILNPRDNVAFLRVINTPTRGIGKTTIQKIEALATESNFSLTEAALSLAQNKGVNAGTAKKLIGFLTLVSRLRDESRSLQLNEIYHLALDETGYVNRLKEEDTFEASARIENLEEFNNAIEQFEAERGEEANLQYFLEEMALVSEADQVEESAAAVTLMTLHISKGLEYPCVFIVGMEDNLFPGARSLESLDPTDLEEERRLAYVGMTRAEKRLYLTYARRRKVWGMDQHNPPSRFLSEIPKEYVKGSSSVVAPRFVERYKSSRSETSEGSFSERLKKRHAKNGNSSSKPVSWDDAPFDKVPEYETESQEGSNGYGKGSQVRHPTFGVGTIYKTEGQGEMQKVTILFNDNSIRKFVVKYARLEPV